MRREKERSIEALRSAREISMRPHLLLCAVCQYGLGIRSPFAEDNLPEFLDIVFNENPDIMITLVPGADWMMCAPCPWRVPDRNACFTGRNYSGGLYNQIKDLNVLQSLGLTYGTKMTAREFLPTGPGENPPDRMGLCVGQRRSSSSLVLVERLRCQEATDTV